MRDTEALLSKPDSQPRLNKRNCREELKREAGEGGRMSELAQRTRERGSAAVRQVVEKLAHELPKLGDLDAEQLEKLASMVGIETN